MNSPILQTLTNTPPQAWATLSGVVIGSIMTMIGVWLTNRAGLHRLEIQHSHEKLIYNSRAKRERLEDLYVQLGQWMNSFYSYQISAIGFMQGKITLEIHLENLKENEKHSKHDFNRIEMLIAVYGNEFKDHFTQLISAKQQLNEIDVAHDKAHKEHQSGDRFVQPFMAAQQNFHIAGEKLKNSIAAAARAA